MSKVLEKTKEIFKTIKGDFGYTNIMETPKLEKITVSVGVGTKIDKRKAEVILDRIIKITGQKPVTVLAKKSIASFKVREGQLSAYKVTLRGEKMINFFDKLVNIVLPRIRDFRGIKLSAVDKMGNLTIGIKEHTAFPETGDEELKNIFGLGVVINTTASNKKEAEAFFKTMGVPFKKDENKK